MIARHAAVALVVVWSTISQSCNQVGVGASSDSTILDLLLERDELSRIGLHSPMGNRKLHRTMEPDLDGRTVRRRQSRPEVLSDTNRDFLSDLPHLGLDLVTRRQFSVTASVIS